MRYTNDSNLPEPLFKAVCNDPYNPTSDFTVTGLIKPARIAALEHQHREELVEDAADRLWSLMGQLGHLVLERAGLKTGEYVEKRHTVYRKRNLVVAGAVVESKTWSISGQTDLWRSSIVVDYKFTSIWSVKDGLKPEWEQQCNLNALLCRENSIDVREAQIVVIFRDWSVGEARRSSDYPQKQVQILNVPLWEPARQEAYLEERLAEHIAARAGVLPFCSPTDRWLRPEKWAIRKKSAAKATKLFDEEHEARNALLAYGPGYELEHRPPVQTRCLDYCPASKWCDQFKQNDPEGWGRAQ